MPALDPRVIEDAIRTLSAPGIRITDAADKVPNCAGLYAFRAPPPTWDQLGLTAEFAHQPLYVGKAEASLASRDVKTHFETGKTGSSTVRRSFAALLRDSLELRATPRNLLKPGYFSNYGLEEQGDLRLTDWMHAHLTLEIWTKPIGVVLRTIEIEVLRRWNPPLNLTDVAVPSPRLKAARRAMAADARSWTLRD